METLQIYANILQMTKDFINSACEAYLSYRW